MRCKDTLASVCALILVICITDQLSGVSGHSLKSVLAARSETNGGKKTGTLMEEIQNEIRNKRRQQQKTAINHVRSATRSILSARLDHTFTSSSSVGTIHRLAATSRTLYVGYHSPTTVALYDASTFSLQRRPNVTGLGCITDMASCPDCDVVFIADFCSSMIHVIDDVGQVTAQWSVVGSERPSAISVTAQSNVIVRSYWPSRTLRQYTSSGRLVREIALQADVWFPWHAIQLDSDRYAVSHTGNLDRVCIVNGNGAVVGQCYGGQHGSGVGQLFLPVHLAIFDESLLVADRNNFRVVQLHVGLSSLTYMGELVNTRSEGYRPQAMAVNEDDARLYVMEDDYITRRISIYNLIFE